MFRLSTVSALAALSLLGAAAQAGPRPAIHPAHVGKRVSPQVPAPPAAIQPSSPMPNLGTGQSWSVQRLPLGSIPPLIFIPPLNSSPNFGVQPRLYGGGGGNVGPLVGGSFGAPPLAGGSFGGGRPIGGSFGNGQIRR